MFNKYLINAIVQLTTQLNVVIGKLVNRFTTQFNKAIKHLKSRL